MLTNNFSVKYFLDQTKQKKENEFNYFEQLYWIYKTFTPRCVQFVNIPIEI